MKYLPTIVKLLANPLIIFSKFMARHASHPSTADFFFSYNRNAPLFIIYPKYGLMISFSKKCYLFIENSP
jgi:hypothetical protein